MNITEANTWSPVINRIETTDPLLGGSDTSPLNLAVAQLAARTNFLRLGLGGFSAVVPFNSNHTLTAADVLLSLVVINAANATLTIILPALADASLYEGARVTIAAINVNKSQVKVSAAGTDKIIDGLTLKSNIYLGDGDTVQLVLTSTGWLFYDYKGNFDDVGGIEYSYKSRANTIVAQGQALNRADYPRLWEWVQTLGPSLVSDTFWASTPGFYSTGNTTTTFRVPDLRGMFLRSLDLGAGIDLGRPSNNPGEYEVDDFKSHTHTWEMDSSNDALSGSGYIATANSSAGGVENNHARINATGGLETRPKNIGLLPLIKV